MLLLCVVVVFAFVTGCLITSPYNTMQQPQAAITGHEGNAFLCLLIIFECTVFVVVVVFVC